MTAATASHTPLAPLVDETKLGSSLGQAMTGVAGIVLAVVLVIGQISLATTKGLAEHLHQNVVHTTRGNEVMVSVIERASVSPKLAAMMEEQSATLASTRDTMQRTNAGMGAMSGTATELDGVVARMEGSSSSLATSISGIQGDSEKMAELLGSLPAKTEKTQTALSRINNDTIALNTELGTIAAKMQGYGLPRAKGAPRT